uniref:long-chain-fatty-acid--CoA ligase n=1 Tax=Gopherus evgoodei TaxID=1825980 RepID=A0A8C4Y8S3_9SAUR
MIWLLDFLFSPLPTPALIGLVVLGAAIFFWVTTRPKTISPPIDLNNQSIGIQGGARRSTFLPENELLAYYYEDAKTMYEAFQRGLHVSENGPCLGLLNLLWRKHLNYRTYLGNKLRVVASLTVLFLASFVQWIISEYACYTYSMVAVPLYDTLGPDAIVFIINKADISMVICDKPEKALILLENCEQGKIPDLKTIILMDLFEDELKDKGAKEGVEILSFQEAEVCEPLTYSDPKGAMLTHENVVANAAAFLKSTEVSCCFRVCRPTWCWFLWRLVILSNGARVGFFQGDIRLLTDDMKTLKPTVFPTVPRLLNRISDKIQSGAQNPLKRVLLNFALARKLDEVKKGILRNDSIWDKMIFKKVQETMGGQVRIMVTAAAPISPSVLTLLRGALGCQIFEAYGQTECAAGCTFTVPGDCTTGHVGAPLPCNIIKLEDVADMNYFSSNNEGEVCIKGSNVFKGYLKDPERTAEAIDKDGWLHTGDIGKWMPNGTLKIIDRKKNIFKLAQGEYIAPEKIENVYIRSTPVAQVFVHGESLKSSLVGIVVPDPEVLPKFAAKLGIKDLSEETYKNSVLKKAILEDMVKIGREAGLKSFEQVKDIYIHPEMFTIEQGLLTPTLKAKRAELSKYFQTQLEALYANMQE